MEKNRPRGPESAELFPTFETGEALNWTEDERARRDLVEKGRTVLANLGRDHALIAWAQGRGLFERIDRGTPFGNPFRIGKDGDRAAVCEKFARFLGDHPELRRAAERLRGKVLGCHCYPFQCHGEAYAEAIGEDLAHVKERPLGC